MYSDYLTVVEPGIGWKRKCVLTSLGRPGLNRSEEDVYSDLLGNMASSRLGDKVFYDLPWNPVL
jgi:hypothetical protein